MPNNRNRGRAAFVAILVLSTGLSVFGGAATAGEDHAYLPPWMRENVPEAATSEQAQAGQQPVVAAAVQISQPGSQDNSSSGLRNSASAAKTRVVRFVNKIFSRIGL